MHYLLQAFAELNLDKAELWLMGSAPGPAFGRLIEKYKSDNVRFLGTFPLSGLREIYAQGSVFVLPSLADGFGMVVPPGDGQWTAGYSDTQRRRRGYSHGGRGWFCRADSRYRGAQAKTLKLYNDPEKARRMSAAAVSKSRAQLSWDAYGDRLVRYLGCDTESRVPVSAATTPDRINLHPGSTLP